ncbi:adhesin biosynthesis transcription regulatory family protein [Salmonella enterica]|nr:adhesin biosynthesis transcription regulatory family protein [Salmonella enterica]
MNDNSLLLDKNQSDFFIPGKMPEFQFWLLIEISPIHSEKIILALNDFLVKGYSRKEACGRYNISPGYFSGALGRFQRVSLTVAQLVSYYDKPKTQTLSYVQR